MFIDTHGDRIISLSSVNFPDYFIRHSSYQGYISPITTDVDKQDATFIVRRDLRTLWQDKFNTISLEAINFLGYFLVVQDGLLNLVKIDADSDYSLKDKASFEVYEEDGIISLGTAKGLWDQDGELYIRQESYRLKFDRKDDSAVFEQDRRFKVEEPQWVIY